MYRNLKDEFDLLDQVSELTSQVIDQSLESEAEVDAIQTALETFSQTQSYRGQATSQGLVDGSSFRPAEIPMVNATPKRRTSRDPRFLGTFSPILRMNEESEHEPTSI